MQAGNKIMQLKILHFGMCNFATDNVINIAINNIVYGF